jgi:hypothetical protein
MLHNFTIPEKDYHYAVFENWDLEAVLTVYFGNIAHSSSADWKLFIDGDPSLEEHSREFQQSSMSIFFKDNFMCEAFYT